MRPRGLRLRIASVVGARPQFIKAAVLCAELAQRRDCEHVLINTGQHYDYGMSQIFFDELHMPEADISLEVGSATHGEQTGEMLRRLEPALARVRPDYVVVFGDTNSTLAGALAAVKLGLTVVHVEAGLRSFDRAMPEEINRIVVDHIAAIHFAPNDRAVAQLAREDIRACVREVGDLMVDLALTTAASLPRTPAILERLGVTTGGYALATVHRAANTDDAGAFARIVAGLRELALPVIFPIHPRSRALANAHGVGRAGDSIVACDPVSYREMIALERHARVILTDSGGVQKEAFALGVPCVTLRTTTEWTETLEGGWNVLTGADRDAIVRAAQRPRPVSPHGYAAAGRCAASICDVLSELRDFVRCEPVEQIDGAASYAV
ncbi:MAG TPA: UDP-N-acetylglucosamine 2-epimerase (non-hydrolyzing) [Candidatus Eremiobacteraceae bacterium]|nr:UDP-N-acetylglucosamine 2-epimerase (non-hydrolyzing) [Candidatus Eremiobacteraceae bacterium]